MLYILCLPHEWSKFKFLNREFTKYSQIKNCVRRSPGFEGKSGFSPLTVSREAPQWRKKTGVARRGAVSEEGEDLAAGPCIAGSVHNDPGRRSGGNQHVVHGDAAATIAAAVEATSAEAVTVFCLDLVN